MLKLFDTMDINQELKKALKNKDKQRLNVIRMIKSKIEEEKKKKDNQRNKTEVIQSYKKSLQKSIKIKNIPQDFIDKTKQEIEIINQFLPQEISYDEALKVANQNKDLNNKEKIMHKIKNYATNNNKLYSGKVAFLAIKEVLN